MRRPKRNDRKGIDVATETKQAESGRNRRRRLETDCLPGTRFAREAHRRRGGTARPRPEQLSPHDAARMPAHLRRARAAHHRTKGEPRREAGRLTIPPLSLLRFFISACALPCDNTPVSRL